MNTPPDDSATDQTFTVVLSDEIYRDLEEIQRQRGGSIEEALRLALSSGIYLLKEAENGNRILVKRKNAPARELELA